MLQNNRFLWEIDLIQLELGGSEASTSEPTLSSPPYLHNLVEKPMPSYQDLAQRSEARAVHTAGLWLCPTESQPPFLTPACCFLNSILPNLLCKYEWEVYVQGQVSYSK